MSVIVRRPSRAATAGLVAAAALTAAAHSAEAADTLGSAAAGQGRYFGAAVAASHLGEADYAATLDREFSSVTPENEMKWDPRRARRSNVQSGLDPNPFFRVVVKWIPPVWARWSQRHG